MEPPYIITLTLPYKHPVAELVRVLTPHHFRYTYDVSLG